MKITDDRWYLSRIACSIAAVVTKVFWRVYRQISQLHLSKHLTALIYDNSLGKYLMTRGVDSRQMTVFTRSYSN